MSFLAQSTPNIFLNTECIDFPLVSQSILFYLYFLFHRWQEHTRERLEQEDTAISVKNHLKHAWLKSVMQNYRIDKKRLNTKFREEQFKIN